VIFIRKAFYLLLFSISISSCLQKRENIENTSIPIDNSEHQLIQKDVFSPQLVEFYINQYFKEPPKESDTTAFQLKDRRYLKLVEKVYRNRNYEPIWEFYETESNLSKQYLEILNSSEKEGLYKEEYFYDFLEKQITLSPEDIQKKAEWAAQIDIALTASFLKLNRHISFGRTNPVEENMRILTTTDSAIKPDSLISLLLAYGEVEKVIDHSRPQQYLYKELKEILNEFQSWIVNPDWKEIEKGENLSFGSRSERVKNLKSNLEIAGFLTSERNNSDADLFDRNTEQAVWKYRLKNGLEPSYIGDKEFFEDINNIGLKIIRLKVNMERLRWLPRNLGKKYIWINIPEFMLRVIENQNDVLNMKIIVGKIYRSTPIFSEDMKYIVFSPYWNVPNNLAKADILPKIKENPNYIYRMRYEIFRSWSENEKPLDPSAIDWENMTAEKFSFRLRQKPGPWNALGKVKFMMPNNYNIYLHDTPERNLFDKEERMFSSGCIRIEKPVELVKNLFPDLTEKEIHQKMQKRKEEYANLKEPVPVHIVYITMLKDSTGNLVHFKDHYKEDEALMSHFPY
jgi:L,D-transpeptidase YcbB